MAKLVDNPLDAAVFLPRLLPDLEKMAKEISDPEARSVAEKARETLIRVGADGKEAASLARYAPADRATTEKALLKALADAGVSGTPCKTVTDYAVAAALALSDAKVFEVEEWACLGPLLEALFAGAAADAKDKAAAVAKAFVRACEVAAEDKAEEDDDDVGVDLCNCEFSLAYGGKILLNNARLRLKRGSRYGLCGANGCGKSTLMRAIANGQLEGFPPASELRTVSSVFSSVFLHFFPRFFEKKKGKKKGSLSYSYSLSLSLFPPKNSPTPRSTSSTTSTRPRPRPPSSTSSSTTRPSSRPPPLPATRSRASSLPSASPTRCRPRPSRRSPEAGR